MISFNDHFLAFELKERKFYFDALKLICELKVKRDPNIFFFLLNCLESFSSDLLKHQNKINSSKTRDNARKTRVQSSFYALHDEKFLLIFQF